MKTFNEMTQNRLTTRRDLDKVSSGVNFKHVIQYLRSNAVLFINRRGARIVLHLWPEALRRFRRCRLRKRRVALEICCRRRLLLRLGSLKLTKAREYALNGRGVL
jgi:hypothetical protein